MQDGSKNIPVGKVIALLAEEGDDISKLEAPREESSSTPKAIAPKKEEQAQPTQPVQSSSSQATHDVQIHHSHPLFPSVSRLLIENGIEDADKIKGTGVRGMLTKGDVLSFLGRASTPLGTYKETKSDLPSPKKAEEPKVCRIFVLRGFSLSTLCSLSMDLQFVDISLRPYCKGLYEGELFLVRFVFLYFLHKTDTH